MPVYDAFISYSHAKDKPIAAALQSVIQKLGKPWYRRRALRVFRDDTSLSATPQLWPSIEQALSQSRYLLLLASPEAAASLWVGKEVEYWLTHKSADTLLIGVTDGTLSWNEKKGDFNWKPKPPLPAPLKGRFAAEPKWVDLSAYRDGADPRDARFIELGADFAAAIHGTPKEDLLSQEVRQQRRALQLAVGAAAVMLLLAVGAVTAGIIARYQADRAEKNFAAAKDTVNSLIFDISQGLRHVEGIRVESLAKILDRVRITVDELASTEPDNTELLHSRAAMLAEFATTYLAAGDLAGALKNAEQSLALARALVALDEKSPRWQRDLSVSLTKVGDVKLASGDTAGARAPYEEALAIRRKLAVLGTVLSENDLAAALDRIGDLEAMAGNTRAALAAFEEGIAIQRRLLEIAKGDAAYSRSLSEGLERIGAVKLASGDEAGALEAYAEAKGIGMALVAADPGNTSWQRDLSVVLNRIGDAYLDYWLFDDALEAYQEALAIRRSLLGLDPDNAHWQRDVMLALEKVGRAKLGKKDFAGASAAYDEALTISRTTASKDGAGQSARQDLGRVLDSVGEVKARADDQAGALAFYDESLTVYRRLVETDPKDLNLQYDMSVTLIKLGDVKGAQGDSAAAANAFGQAVEIRRRGADVDAANVEWKTSLILALYKLALVTEGERKKAATDEALALFEALDEAGKLTSKQKTWRGQLLALRQGPQAQ